MAYVSRRMLAENDQYVRKIEAERDDLKRQLAAADHQYAELQRKLWDAKRPVPTELSEVTAQLRGTVPSIVQAPAFHVLEKATDAQAYGIALHLLLLHAQQVGRKEGAR